MNLGVSTSCFFPLETEKSLERLASLGVKRAEIFLNTYCETDKDFIAGLKKQSAEAGIDVVAFHPFTSGMEPLYFASSYQRRIDDGIKLYRKLFECANSLGAKIFTMHGDVLSNPLNFDYYCDNFAKLSVIAKEYNITLCQENVVRCKSGNADNIKAMRERIGDIACFTLDIKQAFRSGEDLLNMIDVMGSGIKHLHISDHTDTLDCLPPGTGNIDYTKVISRLEDNGFNGDIILELYRQNFGDDTVLTDSIKYLEKFI